MVGAILRLREANQAPFSEPTQLVVDKVVSKMEVPEGQESKSILLAAAAAIKKNEKFMKYMEGCFA